MLDRRPGARTVDVSLPGRSAVRLRVRDGELPALRARVASIAPLLALPSPASAAPLLQARIEIQAPGHAVVSLPFADRDLGQLAAGTRLRVVVENGSEGSVDAGIVHLPLTGPATRVFPPFEGDSNRLPPAVPPQVSRFEREFEVTTQGAAGAPEWLVLVAAPAGKDALPRRFALFVTLRRWRASVGGWRLECGNDAACRRRPGQARMGRVAVRGDRPAAGAGVAVPGRAGRRARRCVRMPARC
jgi:hypothetical protein